MNLLETIQLYCIGTSTSGCNPAAAEANGTRCGRPLGSKYSDGKIPSEERHGSNFIERNPDGTGIGEEVEEYGTSRRSNAKKELVRAITERITSNPVALAAGLKLYPAGANMLDFQGKPIETDEQKISHLVNERIKGWQETAGDHTPRALAMQIAVKEEFGLTTNPFVINRETESTAEDIDWIRSLQVFQIKLRSDSNKIHAESGEFNKLFVRAMYENTQEALKQAGITEVTLWRAMSWTSSDRNISAGAPKWLREMGTGYANRQDTKITSQPANSWASEKSGAEKFMGGDKNSVMLSMTVPVERILGTARTGFGCLSEYEFIVLGDDDDVMTAVKGHN